MLVKAFSGLARELYEVKLVIVGPDEGYLLSLKKLTADLKIDNKVIFTGPLYEKNKLEAYIDADIFVLPSTYETFPIAVMEALACNIPVILTKCCGIADIIDGKSGYAVDLNISQMKDAMVGILTDSVLARKFGEAGRKMVVERFNWKQISGTLEQIYLEAKTRQLREYIDFHPL